MTSPSAELRGHLHCVSGLAWPVEGALFSGGWDHSVRRWDVAVGAAVDTYSGSKVTAAWPDGREAKLGAATRAAAARTHVALHASMRSLCASAVGT